MVMIVLMQTSFCQNSLMGACPSVGIIAYEERTNRMDKAFFCLFIP